MTKVLAQLLPYEEELVVSHKRILQVVYDSVARRSIIMIAIVFKVVLRVFIVVLFLQALVSPDVEG